MFVLILFDFCRLHQRLYNIKWIACSFFIYNICGFIKVWKVTEQLLCTQQQQLLLLCYLQHRRFCYLFNIMASLYVGLQI